MAYLPCLNPNCKSEGRPHPNCHCYDDMHPQDRENWEARGYTFPGRTAGMTRVGVRGGNYAGVKRRMAQGRGGGRYKYQETAESGHQIGQTLKDPNPRGGFSFAHGGEVSHYCELNIPHMPDCPHFKEGGAVDRQPAPKAHPATTLGHAAVHHGLLGMLKDVGHAKLNDPEKHHKTMDKARSHLSSGDHEKAADLLHGHPVAGTPGKNNMKGITAVLGPAIMGQEHNPEALRGSVDYMHSAVKGHDALDMHVGRLLGKEKMKLEPDEKHRESLKEHLDGLRESPEKLLDVGGKFGHYMPDHAAGLGALAATATQYLNSIRPTPTQLGPLDEISPPDRVSVEKYNRQVDIAQHPALILQHTKDGTLIPQDLTTLKTLYPALYQSMAEKATEALIEAKTKDIEIPYRQKMGLSMLLGQPVDSTQTPAAMQAIMKSAGVQQAQNQEQGPQKATAVEMKQINKVDSLSETPLQRRQMGKN